MIVVLASRAKVNILESGAWVRLSNGAKCSPWNWKPELDQIAQAIMFKIFLIEWVAALMLPAQCIRWQDI